MQTIKYKFADGTTNEVEVTEDIYLIHLELLQQEKRNHWKETRRHTSLFYFMENGIDFEDKRRELIKQAYFQEKSFSAIAREKGLSKSSISQQMKTVYKHLRKHLGA